MVNFNYKSRDVATANHSKQQPLLDRKSKKKMETKGKLAAIITGLLIFVLSAGIASSLILHLECSSDWNTSILYSSLCTNWEHH